MVETKELIVTDEVLKAHARAFDKIYGLDQLQEKTFRAVDFQEMLDLLEEIKEACLDPVLNGQISVDLLYRVTRCIERIKS